MADPIIEEIKSKLDIVDVIGSYITLKQAGTNFKGLCPFHGEKTPSFMVNRERQIFRCFGCGEAGDIFAFIQKQENIDFPNALKLLADKAGVQLPEKPSRMKKETPGTDKTTLYAINDLSARFFAQLLTSHAAGKEALAYIKKRGVSEASIAQFQLGYAPVSNTALQAVFKKQNYSPEAIRLAGSPERYRGRIMFPFRDVIGHVVGFSGRAMGEATPKYLNTPETELFRKNRYLYGLYEAKKAIGEAKKVMLVEGQLDLILAHQVGTNYSVATSGTALTDDHLKIIRRYSDVLYFALDGDAAGKKATERGIGMALSHGFEVSVVAIPDGSDPGEVIAKDKEAWLQAVANPVSAIEWLFNHYFPEQRKPTATERERIYDAVFPYIALAPDSVSQSWAFQHLSLLLGVSQDKAIIDAFTAWQQKKDKKPEGKPTVKEPITEATPEPNEEIRRERSLIGLLFIHPEFLEHRQLLLEEKDFTHPALARLYTRINSWYNKTTSPKSSQNLIHTIESSLSQAAKMSLQKLLFDAQTNVADLDDSQLLQEYTFLVSNVRQRLREARIQNFAELIAQAEAKQDRTRVVELMQQMQHTLKEKKFHAKEDS